MEKLVIREATSQDVPKLGQLNHLLIQDEGHENPMGIPALRQRMAMWLKHEYVCYVCLKDEQIAGYALYKSIPKGFYLRQLFVLEKFRRLGIATKLLDKLFDTVWKGKEVRLDVLATNQQAIDFYESYGLTLYCHTFRREGQA